MLFPRASRPRKGFRIKARIFHEQHKLWPLTTAPWLSHYASLWKFGNFIIYHLQARKLTSRFLYDDNRVTIPEKTSRGSFENGANLISPRRFDCKTTHRGFSIWVIFPVQQHELSLDHFSSKSRGYVINISYTHDFFYQILRMHVYFLIEIE